MERSSCFWEKRIGKGILRSGRFCVQGWHLVFGSEMLSGVGSMGVRVIAHTVFLCKLCVFSKWTLQRKEKVVTIPFRLYGMQKAFFMPGICVRRRMEKLGKFE